MADHSCHRTTARPEIDRRDVSLEHRLSKLRCKHTLGFRSLKCVHKDDQEMLRRAAFDRHDRDIDWSSLAVEAIR